MTLRQDVATTIQQHWDEAKAKIQEAFPNLNQESLEAAKANLQGAVQDIATQVSQTVKQVEDKLTQIADELKARFGDDEAASPQSQ